MTTTQSSAYSRPQGRLVADALLDFRAVTKTYGRTTVLDELDLAIPAGGFMVVYGPPASGKSVLMRLLMGLDTPDAGAIVLRGHDVTQTSPADRNIGYIPQSFALYPHQSVYDNIAYPLKLAHAPKAQIDPVVQRVSAMLGITEQLPKRPDQLSGGQKQRVAIARGLAKQTDLYVFDDPLAGLDFKLREQLVDDLRTLQQQTGATFLYTTSDALEALTLADEVAVLDTGRIVDVGDPERVYREPAHVQAMALLGFPRSNLLRGQLTVTNGDARVRTPLFDIELESSERSAFGGGDVLIGIRPESVIVDPRVVATLADAVRLEARVLLREDLGGEEIVYLETGSVGLTAVLALGDGDVQLDDQTTIAIVPQAIQVFSPGSGTRLGAGRSGAGMID